MDGCEQVAPPALPCVPGGGLCRGCWFSHPRFAKGSPRKPEGKLRCGNLGKRAKHQRKDGETSCLGQSLVNFETGAVAFCAQ